MQKPQKINRIECTWVFDGSVCVHGELKELKGKLETCEECEFGRIVFKNEIAEQQLVNVDKSEVKRLKREITIKESELSELRTQLATQEKHLAEDREQLKATQTQHTFKDIKGTAIRGKKFESFGISDTVKKLCC